MLNQGVFHHIFPVIRYWGGDTDQTIRWSRINPQPLFCRWILKSDAGSVHFSDSLRSFTDAAIRGTHHNSHTGEISALPIADARFFFPATPTREHNRFPSAGLWWRRHRYWGTDHKYPCTWGGYKIRGSLPGSTMDDEFGENYKRWRPENRIWLNISDWSRRAETGSLWLNYEPCSKASRHFFVLFLKRGSRLAPPKLCQQLAIKGLFGLLDGYAINVQFFVWFQRIWENPVELNEYPIFWILTFRAVIGVSGHWQYLHESLLSPDGGARAFWFLGTRQKPQLLSKCLYPFTGES